MSLVGESKLAILERLDEEPAHGYALAEELDLSHGYIYTHLKDLRSEGMIEIADERDGKKFHQLTDRGRLLLEALEG